MGMGSNADVLIIGGGLAGLCCALRLHQSGISSQILEASDGVGGRVRTDKVEGFLLDRGFQVLLTAYPEARRVLDYDALGLRLFYPGALIRYKKSFYRFADPWRRPIDGLLGLFTPVGSFSDKLRVRKLRSRVLTGSLSDLYNRPETTTLQALRNIGFSEGMIDRFFRPFIGGVFFDSNLGVSSRMFEFGFRMFSMGDTALPSGGMGAIPEQIAARLPAGTVRTEARVESVQEGGVTLQSGEKIKAHAVVVATEGPEAARLLGDKEKPGSRSVSCLYYETGEPPVSEPLLILNGEGKGPINSLCCPSSVAPNYAPKGKSLVSVTMIGVSDQGDQRLESAVRTQLTEWFGSSVKGWRYLRIYRIPHALPMQVPPVSDPASRPAQIRPGLFVSGEYQNVASIQWAMVSGRQAAEAVIDWLRK
jgi:phytoene dehydrogenase-like protein